MLNPATGWHIQNNTVNWYVLNILQQNVDSLTCVPQGAITTAVSGAVIGPWFEACDYWAWPTTTAIFRNVVAMQIQEYDPGSGTPCGPMTLLHINATFGVAAPVPCQPQMTATGWSAGYSQCNSFSGHCLKGLLVIEIL